jgi:pyruvate dehydrogenase E2 component (dihydrolipoamide acetyltransferase)
MRVAIDLPALGFDMESGTLGSWLKQVGDSVDQGEPIAEVETEKATVDIESPASGTLVEVRFAAGDEVPVGEILGYVDDGS